MAVRKLNNQLNVNNGTLFTYVGENRSIEDLFLAWDLTTFANNSKRFDTVSFSASFALNKIPMATIALPVGVRLNLPDDYEKSKTWLETLFGTSGSSGFSAQEPFLIETTKLLPVLVSYREASEKKEHVIFRGFLTKKQLNRAAKQQSVLVLELTHWAGLLDMVALASQVIHTETTGDLRFRAFVADEGQLATKSAGRNQPPEVVIHESITQSFGESSSSKLIEKIKNEGIWSATIGSLKTLSAKQAKFPIDLKVPHPEELEKIRKKTNNIISLLLARLDYIRTSCKSHVPAVISDKNTSANTTSTAQAIAGAFHSILENSMLTASYWQYITQVAGTFDLSIVPTVDTLTVEPIARYPYYFSVNVADSISADTVNTYSRPILGVMAAISGTNREDMSVQSDKDTDNQDTRTFKTGPLFNPYLANGKPLKADDYDFGTLSYDLTPGWLKFTSIAPSDNPARPSIKKRQIATPNNGGGTASPDVDRTVDNSDLVYAITKAKYYEILNRDKSLKFKETLRFDICPGASIAVGEPANLTTKNKNLLGVCYGGIVYSMDMVIDSDAKVVCTDYTLVFAIPVPFAIANDADAKAWLAKLKKEPYFPNTCFYNAKDDIFAQKTHPVFNKYNAFIWRNLME